MPYTSSDEQKPIDDNKKSNNLDVLSQGNARNLGIINEEPIPNLDVPIPNPDVPIPNVDVLSKLAALQSDLKILTNRVEPILNLFSPPTIIGLGVAIIIPIAGGVGSLYTLDYKVGEINHRLEKIEKTAEEKNIVINQLTGQIQTVNAQVNNLVEDKFPIGGWSNYGGLEVSSDAANQKVSFNGKFPTAAGYVKQTDSGFYFGGKILTLKIENSAKSSFDQGKMFKLEVNGQYLQPQEDHRINANDKSYVNAGDGTVSFKLPDKITKIEFVFWNANLNNLTISGTLGH